MAKTHILETQIATMQEVLDQVSSQNSEYLEVRNRFFSVFGRDKLRENLSGTDVQVIQRRNTTSRCGHIIVDAKLFLEGHRTDEYISRQVYGVSPLIA